MDKFIKNIDIITFLAVISYIFIAYIIFSVFDIWDGNILAINFFNIF